MIYLVEGLNASGKSTYIRGQLQKNPNAISFSTPWLNPLRHPEKFSYWITDWDSFLYGAYESVCLTLKVLDKDVYWDRTFISAWAYNSHIERSTMMDLLGCFKKKEVKLILLDTPIDICMDRFYGRDEDKSYVEHFDDKKALRAHWVECRERLVDTFNKFYSL